MTAWGDPIYPQDDDTILIRVQVKAGSPRTPTTAAGRALLTFLNKESRSDTSSQSWRNGMDYAAECVERSLPAIEAEARADLPAMGDADRLAALLHNLQLGCIPLDEGCGPEWHLTDAHAIAAGVTLAPAHAALVEAVEFAAREFRRLGRENSALQMDAALIKEARNA
jgi:hypothetical protein